jgi:hypothetical protein
MKLSLGRVALINAAFIAAGSVLAVSIVVGTEREQGEPGGAPPSHQASAKGLLIDLDLSLLDRATNVETHDELFPVRAPKAQPAPPIPTQAVIQAPAPKPVAPPLPFKYLGLMVDRGQVIVFLGRGDDLMSLKQGEVVANQYRVEDANEAAVTFTYLPLNEKQTLHFGRRN